MKQTGIMSSALENAVPEQMFSDDSINPLQAVSTTKIFTLANLQGQKFYQITKSNLVSAHKI